MLKLDWRCAALDLNGRLNQIADGFSGLLGLSARNLTTGEGLELNAGESFCPASTIKLPILYEVFRGALRGEWSLSDRLRLTAANRVEGSGVLVDLTEGLELSLRDTAMLMVVVSDNTATNMLIDLCGTDAVNRAMSDLGISGVRLNRKIGLQLEMPLGTATPTGMARLMELIATEQVLTPAACAEILEILRRQKHKEFTNRFILESDAEEGDAPVQIASKSGWVRGVRNDVALIQTPRSRYILSIFSRDCQDRRYWVDNEGSIALARVSEAVYQAWGRTP